MTKLIVSTFYVLAQGTRKSHIIILERVSRRAISSDVGSRFDYEVLIVEFFKHFLQPMRSQ